MKRILPHILFLIAIGATLAALLAEEPGVPCWCVQGIAAVETRSHWDDAGRLHYVDRRVGFSGEMSAFQITRAAFNQVRARGERFADLARDQSLALAICCRYLARLYRTTGSWEHAVSAYNVGLRGDRDQGLTYLRRVQAAADLQ